MKSTKANTAQSGSQPAWKAKLLQVKQMQGQSGLAMYDRAKLLVEVYDDIEFRQAHGNYSEDKVVGLLDKHVGDMFFTTERSGFLTLRSLLQHYPNRDQWSKGNLSRMYKDLVESTQSMTKRAKGVRDTCTIAERDALKQEIKALKAQLDRAKNQIRELQTENTRLRGRAA